jgi:hypothetical protein
MKKVSAKSTQVSAMDLQIALNSSFMQFISFALSLACFILACQPDLRPDRTSIAGDAAAVIDGVNITGCL